MLQCTRLSFTPVPTSFSSFTRPPQRCFHTDSSARLVGQRNHRAAAGRDKNWIYCPLNTFPFKGDQRTKGETVRTVTLILMELTVAQTGLNRQLQSTANKGQWIAEAIVWLPLLLLLKLLVYSLHVLSWIQAVTRHRQSLRSFSNRRIGGLISGFS